MSIEITKPVEGTVTIDFETAKKFHLYLAHTNHGNIQEPENKDLAEFYAKMCEALDMDPYKGVLKSEYQIEFSGGFHNPANTQLSITKKSTGTDEQW